MKMKIKIEIKTRIYALIATGAVMLLLFCAPCSGEPLSLDECVDMALERNTSVRLALKDAEIAESKITQAKADALPSLGLTGEYRRLDELETVSFGDQSIEVGTLDNYSIEAMLSQLIYSGGVVDAGIEAARYSREYSKLKLKDAERNLVRSVKTGFYDVMLARETIGVREESVEQLARALEQTRKRFKEGTVSEFDVISSSVSLANEKPKLISARNQYNVALETFSNLIKAGEGELELSGSLDELLSRPDTNIDTEAVIDARPDISALKVQQDLQRQDVRAAKGKLLPRVEATLLYGGANSRGFVSYDAEWEWRWNASISLNWDIWDSNLQRARVREKNLRLSKAVVMLEDKKEDARLQVRRALLDLEHASEALDASGGNVELARKGFKIATARYEEGLTTLVELKQSNLALSEARLGRLKSLREYLVAIADFEYAAGWSR